MKARKRFGQHFLTDEGVLSAIVAAVKPGADDRLLEIGPGHAALTELLYPDAGHMVAIEIDRDLIAMLKARFDRLQVINADVLTLDLSEILGNQRWRLVGNLPYNISSPLLIKLYRHLAQIQDMHFMFQRELSQRLAARPGTKDWGRLSVMTQYFCNVQPLFDVPPEAFDPPPQVFSQVIRLWPRQERTPVRMDVFSEVLRMAFSARRKRLSNALKSFELDWDALEAQDIRPSQRPDQLSVDAYVHIAVAVDRSRECS